MQTNVKSIAVSTQSQPSPQTERGATSDYIIELIPIFSICLGIVLVTVTCNYLPKIIRPVRDAKSIDKFPCRHCQYFNSNYHIKCAVNPSNVMTERAVDCRDYHPD